MRFFPFDVHKGAFHCKICTHAENNPQGNGKTDLASRGNDHADILVTGDHLFPAPSERNKFSATAFCMLDKNSERHLKHPAKDTFLCSYVYTVYTR